jgi:VIT1/CCC1 family predicted Fe2+/Mn2+ transporter
MNIKKSLKVGMGFGLSSATITTLGIIVGLYSSTNSLLAVIGGVLTVAVADAFSDALGIHIAKESEGNFSSLEVWQATISTFFFKFIFASSFLLPIMTLPIKQAVIVALVWGVCILVSISYMIAKDTKQKPAGVITEHLTIATAVMFITYYLGQFIAKRFN